MQNKGLGVVRSRYLERRAGELSREAQKRLGLGRPGSASPRHRRGNPQLTGWDWDGRAHGIDRNIGTVHNSLVSFLVRARKGEIAVRARSSAG